GVGVGVARVVGGQLEIASPLLDLLCVGVVVRERCPPVGVVAPAGLERVGGQGVKLAQLVGGNLAVGNFAQLVVGEADLTASQRLEHLAADELPEGGSEGLLGRLRDLSQHVDGQFAAQDGGGEPRLVRRGGEHVE